MSKYIGRLVNVGVAREATRGTAVAASMWLPKAVVAFFDRAIRHQSKLNYGSIAEGADAPKIMEWAEGTLEGDVFDKSFGYILYAAFGTLNTTGPSSGAYTHTFSLENDNQHDSLTLTLSDPDRSDRYSLCMLDKVTLTFVTDDVVTYSADFKGRTGRQIATPTVRYTAENKFLGRHVTIKTASAASGLAAASALTVKSVKLTIAKNVALNNVLGTVWPDDIINQKIEITGTIELDLDDQTYRQYLLDASYKALRIAVTNSDIAIPGGSTNPSFTLDLARVTWDAWEPARPNDAIVTQKINFRALWDATNQELIHSCVLINGKSSYTS